MKTTVPPLAERVQPGLSATLPYQRQPDTCQGCGMIGTLGVDPLPLLNVWIECDPWDRPGSVVVVLCVDCGSRLIDPHSRLYVALDKWEPRPGVMPLCLGCRYHDALTCRHPDLTANGGTGLGLTVGQPTVAHLNMGRGRGRWIKIWPKPASACAGRDVAA